MAKVDNAMFLKKRGVDWFDSIGNGLVSLGGVNRIRAPYSVKSG